MSQTQQKLMQYLPVFFAVFQVFFLAALVVYYIFQTLLRIAQQVYITKAFYGHDEALGRQAQRAGEAARAEAQKSGESTGMFSQAKRDLAAAKGDKPVDKSDKAGKSTDKSGTARQEGGDERCSRAPGGQQAGDASEEPADPVGVGQGTAHAVAQRFPIDKIEPTEVERQVAVRSRRGIPCRPGADHHERA